MKNIVKSIEQYVKNNYVYSRFKGKSHKLISNEHYKYYLEKKRFKIMIKVLIIIISTQEICIYIIQIILFLITIYFYFNLIIEFHSLLSNFA